MCGNVVARVLVLSCLGSASACNGARQPTAEDAVASDGSGIADAVYADSPTPDATPTKGHVLVSWTFIREGVTDPTVTCADLAAEEAWIATRPGFFMEWAAPCEDHMTLSPPLEPGEHPVQVSFARRTESGGYASSGIYMPERPVTVVAGETLHVPFVYRLFDEPIPQLREIFVAAADYYQASADPKVFPPSETAYTPPVFECCNQGGICAPDPSWWTVSPFLDVGFSVEGESRFSYSFWPSGSGTDATFTLRAWADYDCDGGHRTYTMYGSVSPDGTVLGALDIVINELE